MSFQGLLVVYLVVVVVMVKRQIRMVDDEEDEDEEYNKEEIVILTDQKGATDAKPIENIVMKQNEIFLWFITSDSYLLLVYLILHILNISSCNFYL